MRVVFMGSPDFAVPALEALIREHEVCLVVTQPDKPAGRGKRLSAPPVKPVAEAAGIPVAQPKSARGDDFAELLREQQAEVGIVVAYGKILPPAVLEAFPRGCLNIHGSLLPKYRGAAPIQRAVMDGETESGVTIMQLDEGMDTGPVLLRKVEPIRSDDTAGSYFERLAPLGAAALLEALAGLEAGTLEPVPQDDSLATHAAMLAKSDGLVDWSQPADRVAARMRGLDPWPGSFTPFGDGNLKLFGVSLTEDEGAPGAVLAYDKAGIVIACGSGAVRIREVQAPGKRRIAAEDFARGRRLELGTILGVSAAGD